MNAKQLLYSLFFLGNTAVQATHKDGIALVPNSCTDLPDGEYSMKLIDEDDYPVVSIKCSNGYGILDYSEDSGIVSYLNTYYNWFPDTIGPTNDIHVNWEEWFLPHSDGLTNYAISPDCSTCDADNSRQLYDTQTTYWMTGTIFGCFWAVKGNHNCDIDYDTSTCYTCDTARGESFVAVDDDSSIDDYHTTGICPHNVQSSDYYTPTVHDDCSESESEKDLYHLKPSLGTAGRYCVCFQQDKTDYFEVTSNKLQTHELAAKLKRLEDDGSSSEDIKEDVHYIYQSDFDEGTLRIRESGTYIIMEDIVFDFNSNEDEPNKDRAYLPEASQADDYPGAGTYKGSFFLGFFAGITIECADVVLDLNQKTLRMSNYFYLQQRWFTTIELSTQYFLPGQGTGNFGGAPSYAENVEIKNGNLGLTSHHGIHGNSNKNVKLTNLRVYDFETHGIQFNGFENIEFSQIEVGPTSNKVMFNGEYGHMRQLLPRYKNMADELDADYEAGTISDDEYYIQFDGRDDKTTMREIAEDLELHMNIAFDYVMKEKNYQTQAKENSEVTVSKFNEAKRLFVNQERGFITNAAAQYGIFLNTFGASVFTYNLQTNYYSTGATLTDIKIHGMRHSMKEYVQWKEYGTKNLMVNPFGGPLDVYELLQDVDDLDAPRYKGNFMTDAAIASNYFSNSFDMLALQVLKNDYVVPWALGEDYDTVVDNDINSIQIGCNSDVMIHSGKGINGLRLDGVQDIYIKNIEVFDLEDQTPEGDTVCGEYSAIYKDGATAQWGGHFRQQTPMQTGFSGNMNQAININAAQNVVFENVNIHDISSWTGPAFGISIWPSCDVTLKGDIAVNGLQAGKNIVANTYDYGDRPNKAPEVCGVRTYYSFLTFDTTLTDEEATYHIDLPSLSGHVGCFGSTTLDRNDESITDGEYLTAESSDSSDSSTGDDLTDDDFDLSKDIDNGDDDDNDEENINMFAKFTHMFKGGDSNVLTISIFAIVFIAIAGALLKFGLFSKRKDGYVAIEDRDFAHTIQQAQYTPI